MKNLNVNDLTKIHGGTNLGEVLPIYYNRGKGDDYIIPLPIVPTNPIDLI